MAIRYVRTNGADGTGGHDGSTPALAWLTLGYAMTNVTAGDTIWVGAGTYRVGASIAPSSMGSMTYCRGDTDGSHTGDAGEIVVTNYDTNDTTAPWAGNVFEFASKNYWTLSGMTIMAGAATGTSRWCIHMSGTSANLTFQDLTLVSATQAIGGDTLTFGTVLNWTIERCRIAGTIAPVGITFPSSASSSGDINANVIIRNCLVNQIGSGAGAVSLNSDAGTARKTGGVLIANCHLIGGTNALWQIATNFSTTYPCTIYNSLVIGYDAMRAAVAGGIVEDYNVIVWANSAYFTNGLITAGTHSYSAGERNWLFSLGHEASYGGVIRSWGEFPKGSPLLTWGGSSATGVPTDDINGVTRPASGAASLNKALGPFERPNSATKETGTVRTGLNAIKFAGPGYQDFQLPVAAASTTVTVYGQFDGSYGAGTKPTMSVRNGGECGVAEATATMTVASGNWEQLSLNFTPTATGIVTIRLASLGSAAAGATFFDDFAVA